MKRIISVILVLTILIVPQTIYGQNNFNLQNLVFDTADYLYNTVAEPQFGSVGGEWTVLGLARSGAEIPALYFDNYYKNTEEYVKNCNGILHNKKHTEYSRLVLALTAIGKNPCNVAGYNLLTSLADYEKTIRQGINGAIWALIALDCGNYDIPVNPDANIQATRQMYVNHILQKQTPDGGWALSGNAADPDVTAMALVALSKYQDNEDVGKATQRALACLSALQNENGGFSSYETENSESTVQVIVALCELGISLYDNRFVKNGNTLLDNLMNYKCPDKGFRHTLDGTENLMATEQAFYGIVALKRTTDKKSSLYNMNDVAPSFNGDKNNTFNQDLFFMQKFPYGFILHFLGRSFYGE